MTPSLLPLGSILSALASVLGCGEFAVGRTVFLVLWYKAQPLAVLFKYNTRTWQYRSSLGLEHKDLWWEKNVIDFVVGFLTMGRETAKLDGSWDICMSKRVHARFGLKYQHKLIGLAW
ncbi:hypothetical protein BYT27DRAFT_7210608 [Phlegmacium glaucopus]|nr:hypothetical protein BYT27DRAFT_7210608 [Phlegmacium glaucopus]